MANSTFLTDTAHRLTEIVEKRSNAYRKWKLDKSLTESAKKRRQEEDLRLQAARNRAGHELCRDALIGAKKVERLEAYDLSATIDEEDEEGGAPASYSSRKRSAAALGGDDDAEVVVVGSKPAAAAAKARGEDEEDEDDDEDEEVRACVNVCFGARRRMPAFVVRTRHGGHPTPHQPHPTPHHMQGGLLGAAQTPKLPGGTTAQIKTDPEHRAAAIKRLKENAKVRNLLTGRWGGWW